MKRVSSVVLIIATLCTFLAFAGVNAQAASKTVDVKVRVGLNYNYEAQVLKLVNQERQKRGLPKLKMSKTLFDYAQQRAVEASVMYYYYGNGMPHVRPDGTTSGKYKGRLVGENSAWGSSKVFSAKEVMDGWMHSKGHKANILSKKYKTIGIGCAISHNSAIWIQVFDSNTAKSDYTKKGSTVLTKSVKITKKYCYINIDTPAIQEEKPLPKKFYIYSTLCDGAMIEPDLVTYSCSNSKVATINSRGLLTFLKPGSVKITAKLKNSTIKYTKTFTYKGPFEVGLNPASFIYNGKMQRPDIYYSLNKTAYSEHTLYCAVPETSMDVGDYNVYTWMRKPEEPEEYLEDPDSTVFYYTKDDEERYTGYQGYYYWNEGGCTDTYVARYTILPDSTEISLLKPTKKTVSVNWEKNAQQTDGYIIEYATSKKFSASTTVKIAGNANTATTIKDLQPGKMYYFRVKTYKAKTVSVDLVDEYDYIYNYYGKSTNNYIKTYYSSWSAVKAVSTKR